MLEISCHTWAFNDLPLSEALGTIARLGFRYVDIGSGPHLNTAQVAKDPRGVAAAIKRELEIYNLKLADLYLMLPRISLADDDKRQKEVELYKSMLPFIVALETPGVTLSPGLAHPDNDVETYERVVSALKEMVEASRLATPATRLHVSIEPHMDSMAQKPDIALQLINDVPHLELTLDWAHMVCQDIFHEDILKLVPYARHIQMRQAARAQLQTPFDRGRIEVDRVVKALHAAHYEGVICVEYMQTTGWHGMLEVNAVREVTRMRDALRTARDALRDDSPEAQE